MPTAAERAKSSDEDLMVLVRTRDYHAFVSLFDRYRAGVVSFAARMTGDPDEAETIARDAFAEMSARASSYKPKKPFKLWLFSILHELTSARLRKHDPASGSSLRALAKAQPASGDTLPASQAERAKPVFEAMGRLKPPYREVACLRIVERMSYEDIATVTGGKLKTVLSRMNYAVEHLRKENPR
ncbi:MAG: RNA polymerase sigma factor [Planctomycetota bacterium]